MPRTVQAAYFAALEDVYHINEDCPIGRRIPDDMRSEGPGSPRSLCPTCRVRAEAAAERQSKFQGSVGQGP